MGTSTCDMLVAPRAPGGKAHVAGICGQVDGSIVPGMIGLEAGQSAFGDVYAWFRDLLSWPLDDAVRRARGAKAAALAKLAAEVRQDMLDRLAEEAAKVDPAESTVIALDWLNGRRTPFADQTLKGAIAGLTLGSTAPRVFRALVEATAFGSRAIVEQFRKEGVTIGSVIALGGIARRSPFVMQITADVLGMPIKVVASEQACALGAGMFAAVAAGIYPSVTEAQKRMGSGFDMTFTPDRKRAAVYDGLYRKYLALGDSLEAAAEDAVGRPGGPHEGPREDREAARGGLPGQPRAGGQGPGDRHLRQRVGHRPGAGPARHQAQRRRLRRPRSRGHGRARPRWQEGRGDLNPSSDTKTHLRLYRAFPGIGGVVHTHSRFATAWAQARRPLPCLGTTHADYFHGAVPCTAVISDAQIDRDYEEETAVQIVEAFKALDYRAMPAVLVASHGPFTWGRDAADAVHHSVMLEYVAEMAAIAFALNPGLAGIRQRLLDKHYLRKHGSDAYYGQAGEKARG